MTWTPFDELLYIFKHDKTLVMAWMKALVDIYPWMWDHADCPELSCWRRTAHARYLVKKLPRSCRKYRGLAKQLFVMILQYEDENGENADILDFLEWAKNEYTGGSAFEKPRNESFFFDVNYAKEMINKIVNSLERKGYRWHVGYDKVYIDCPARAAECEDPQVFDKTEEMVLEYFKN